MQEKVLSNEVSALPCTTLVSSLSPYTTPYVVSVDVGSTLHPKWIKRRTDPSVVRMSTSAGLIESSLMWIRRLNPITDLLMPVVIILLWGWLHRYVVHCGRQGSSLGFLLPCERPGVRCKPGCAVNENPPVYAWLLSYLYLVKSICIVLRGPCRNPERPGEN